MGRLINSNMNNECTTAAVLIRGMLIQRNSIEMQILTKKKNFIENVQRRIRPILSAAQIMGELQIQISFN